MCLYALKTECFLENYCNFGFQVDCEVWWLLNTAMHFNLVAKSLIPFFFFLLILRDAYDLRLTFFVFSSFSLIVHWSGNYLKFFNAIRQAYPDIKMISNCDGSSKQLDHPADFYDYHVIFLSSFLVFHRWMNLVNQFLCYNMNVLRYNWLGNKEKQ